ncbi:hypothetical protein GX645_02480 [Candidatus Sumerlaeota bacterium]|nr:hypothetical protein [Candidatus Sumerlaeota bacterium]
MMKYYIYDGTEMKLVVRNRERGASLVVVLGLLVLLLFLLFSLSYLVLIEGQSGNFYGRQVQARYDAGLANGTAAAVAETATSATIASSRQILTQANDLQQQTGVIENVDDLSGRVNLNYVKDAEAFDRFVRSILESPSESGDVADNVKNAQSHVSVEVAASDKAATRDSATERVQNSANNRVFPAYGRMLVSLLDACREVGKQDDSKASLKVTASEVAAAKDEDGEYVDVSSADSTPPMFVNDAEPLLSLGDATHAVGNYPAPFSADEMARLRPYVTVVSQTPEVYSLASGAHGSRLTTDHASDDPIGVWQALAEAFPDKNERLLMQFAANIIDYFDDNTTPTVMYTNKDKSLDKAVIGVEATALITEVYADSATAAVKGDSGQFVELYNPWGRNLSLAGWQLEVYGLDGVLSSQVSVSANLPAGGVLVVTDLFRKTGESGDGLFDIFGVQPDGHLYNVYEAGGLDLPDFGGYVVLRNKVGDLIDVMSYGPVNGLDSMISWQRSDPTVRVSATSSATPFAIPALMDSGKQHYIRSMASMRLEHGDKGCSSPLDLLRVNSGFADPSSRQFRLWQMPVYNSKATGDDAKLNFDQTVAELFVAGTAIVVEDVETSSVYTRGKLNVNTCRPQALLSLDARGADGQLVLTPQLWKRLTAEKAQGDGAGSNPYRCVTDFVCAVIPSISNESDFSAAVRLLDCVTVSSASYAASVEALSKSSKTSEVSGKQNLIILGGAGGSPEVSSVVSEW